MATGMIALIAALVLFPFVAAAQMFCGDYQAMHEGFWEKHKERLVALGETQRGQVEVLASADGKTWTIWVSRGDGQACALATGRDWTRLPYPKKGEGS